MSEFSDYCENLIINHLLRAQAYTPATMYVALFTAVTGLETNAPTAEVGAGIGYTRQAAGLIAASGGASDNAADIVFGTASADWGTVSHFAIVDHATNTTWGTNVNVLMWSPVTTGKAVNSGDTCKILVGALDVTID